MKPIRLDARLPCRVEAKNLVLADLFSALPHSRRIDSLHVEFDADKPSGVLGALQLLAAAAGSV